jgi:hypothetical protein
VNYVTRLLYTREDELLDSDELVDSRETEERSKLFSVLNNPILNESLCQSGGFWKRHIIRPSVSCIHSQSRFLVVLGLSSEP